MGRGRQKAKQMKVARKLKYFSPETDLDALQRELHGASNKGSAGDDSECSGDRQNRNDDYWDEDEYDGNVQSGGWVSPEAISDR